jgi:hypothetical protein
VCGERPTIFQRLDPPCSGITPDRAAEESLSLNLCGASEPSWKGVFALNLAYANGMSSEWSWGIWDNRSTRSFSETFEREASICRGFSIATPLPFREPWPTKSSL